MAIKAIKLDYNYVISTSVLYISKISLAYLHQVSLCGICPLTLQFVINMIHTSKSLMAREL